MLPGIFTFAGIGGVIPEITQTDSRTTPAMSFTSVSFGEDDPSRFMVVLVFHGDTNTDPGDTPTATIGGVSATLIGAKSTGVGGGGVVDACGVAIFTAAPTGTSGTVSITWPQDDGVTIVVLRLVGYSSTATDFDIELTSGDGSVTTTAVTDGCIIAGVAKGSDNTNITWTGITERGEENLDGADNRRGWAWDIGLTAGGKTISVSPWTVGLGENIMISVSFPPL